MFTPPNDPGIRAESFPELTGGIPQHARLAPDREVIKDLFDVEVQNPKGEWVPMVPYSVSSMFMWHRCLCGEYRFTVKRYQEHYAYAHILGMED